MKKQLTDMDVKQILALKKIKLQPWQIARITGIASAQVKRICKAKAFRTSYKTKFEIDKYKPVTI